MGPIGHHGSVMAHSILTHLTVGRLPFCCLYAQLRCIRQDARAPCSRRHPFFRQRSVCYQAFIIDVSENASVQSLCSKGMKLRDR